MKKIDLALLEPSTNSPPPALPTPKKKVQGCESLSPALVHILQDVQRELGFESREQAEARYYSQDELTVLIQKSAAKNGYELSRVEQDEILEYLEKEQRPFGILQPLVDDPQVSDIIISSYSQVSVQQGRSNYQTDLKFPSSEVYEAFVEKLLLRAGSNYSTKNPIADGMIGQKARIHAVHKVLCEEGPYLTIRINRFSEVRCSDLIRSGLAPEPIFSYLRGMILAGNTLLIVGEVGTGKTTLARALASEIPEFESIIVIEDTPEIQLVHPHVRYLRTREANTDGAGKISPSQCIRGGMRMAMNRIIFGEMRDAEAAEAFIDVCASGHPGLSTIHARSANEAITRLELFLGRAQESVAPSILSQQVATAVQAIVHVDICRSTGVRRIKEVKEIGPVADGALRKRDIFKYQVKDALPSWQVVNKVSAFKDKLEALEFPVHLHSYGLELELSLDIAYKEAAYKHSNLGLQ